jgi:hypothetical protein
VHRPSPGGDNRHHPRPGCRAARAQDRSRGPETMTAGARSGSSRAIVGLPRGNLPGRTSAVPFLRSAYPDGPARVPFRHDRRRIIADRGLATTSKNTRSEASESALVVDVIAGENLALASIRLGPASPTLQRYGPVRYLAAALQGMTGRGTDLPPPCAGPHSNTTGR